MADPIREWLAAFPMDYAAARLEELRDRRDAIDAEIAHIQTYLSEAQTIPVAVSVNGNGHGNGTGHKPANARDAVETVMRSRPGYTWQRREILEELVQRGWTEPGEPGRKKLGSMLYHMVRVGRVERPEENRYRLPDREGVMAA